jgi:hypothetical protein
VAKKFANQNIPKSIFWLGSIYVFYGKIIAIETRYNGPYYVGSEDYDTLATLVLKCASLTVRLFSDQRLLQWKRRTNVLNRVNQV